MMNKRYLEEMRNVEQIKIIEELYDYIEEDEQGYYFINNEEFEWWNELANTMQYLDDKNIKYNKEDPLELEAYVRSANDTL